MDILENFKENYRRFNRKTVKCQYLSTNRHLFVLFVFKLLNHSDETPTLLGGTTPLLGEGGMPLCPPPAGYGPGTQYVQLAPKCGLVFNFSMEQTHKNKYKSILNSIYAYEYIVIIEIHSFLVLGIEEILARRNGKTPYVYSNINNYQSIA